MALAVEFAVASPGSCPVAQASERAGERVSGVSRASIRGDESITEEFRLPADAAGESSVDGVEGLESVATTGSETLYRFERDPVNDCVCEIIEQVVGPATDVRAEDGTLVVTAHVEDLDAVRAVVERLREPFDGVGVRRLTNLEADDRDDDPLDDDGLTDRQREVVQTAYDMGYFEYPKGANAGEVADALDISRSTFAEHLAAATGKLFGAVLAVDSGDAVTRTARARP
ncbi:hypothetical protein SAMN05216559_0048 [Halomicrobium zhouii]|uniref:HTH bat-type domain-containing protein n=1 Tax=Halomicrobium zhouii TaxID=767519 RepID=A0A1I6K1V4_9EURY|nr:helix-turn-helix domain-containing protein [Halomicrobium zhouii]SFR85191.1 hypothetical protein SAMN05216559_0048 [Halomicrobium zhouii]